MCASGWENRCVWDDYIRYIARILSPYALMNCKAAGLSRGLQRIMCWHRSRGDPQGERSKGYGPQARGEQP